ncbi:MAG: bifunctional oligoribonuclease/PAP phosphatase NrnA [Firmicutes bacterium]|nr:bifunctional oligoribonuclease/PAP phosphatase NrnA [Bacillota bacterium]
MDRVGGAAGVARVLASGRRFLLPLHLSPDGDSAGSVLALALLIERLGKEAVVSYERDPLPPLYAFLPGSDRVVALERVRGDFSAALFLDMTDPGRAGEGTRRRVEGLTLVNIDHHPTNSGFGDVCYVDPEAPAVGEMLVAVAGELGVPLDAEVATCLYVALMTDTGSFQYDNATPRAFRAAARLVEAGAQPADIARRVYESRSPAQLRLLHLALATLEVEAGGRVAHMSLTREMMAQAGATVAETDGLINYPRSLAGVEVAVLFREEEDGRIKVGFRSRHLDVGRLAASLGGGGHARASGCVLPGPLPAARDLVLSRVRDVVG